MKGKAILVVIATIIFLLISYVAYSFATRETDSIRTQRISWELSKLVTDTNQSIEQKVLYASGQLDTAKSNVVIFTECVSKNQQAIEFNNKITFVDFINGTQLLQPIDCSMIQTWTWTLPDSSSWKVSEGTASGA